MLLKIDFYVPCWICAMFHKLLWKETFVSTLELFSLSVVKAHSHPGIRLSHQGQ